MGFKNHVVPARGHMFTWENDEQVTDTIKFQQDVASEVDM